MGIEHFSEKRFSEQWLNNQLSPLQRAFLRGGTGAHPVWWKNGKHEFPQKKSLVGKIVGAQLPPEQQNLASHRRQTPNLDLFSITMFYSSRCAERPIEANSQRLTQKYFTTEGLKQGKAGQSLDLVEGS